MARVCPWWLGWLLASPIRRLVQDPATILSPFVSEGMTVLEPGPGMGFFTLELARRVGPTGRVIAVDVQERMLSGLRRRAARVGLVDRIELRLASRDGLGIEDLAGRVDFALAFAMVHEVPDGGRLLAEIATSLRRGGRLLLVEPAGHVRRDAFAATLRSAAEAGLRAGPDPAMSRSHSAVLVRE
jgi:ubiquinone/menaquinone biosynthesis C-methylase UbiE